VVTHHYREFGATPHETEFASSARHLRRIDQGPGNHGTLSSRAWTG
jgi:hypothetical protein